jgi:hypothetical protein
VRHTDSTHGSTGASSILAGALLILGLGTSSMAAGIAVPGFSKQFLPDTIGPGSTTVLRFDITNAQSPLPVTDLAFVDDLPAGVTIATPAAATTTCADASLGAPDGAATITFSGGRLGSNSSCTVWVQVTSSVPGVHTNVSGDLTSSVGNSGPATADLTVDGGRPGFSKAFAPSTVSFGGRSTLTFLLDNTANPQAAFRLQFTDNLPGGLVVANPANAATTCTGAQPTAVPGSSAISLTDPVFAATLASGATCTVTVDVAGQTAGSLTNTSQDLFTATTNFGTLRSSGLATAALQVNPFQGSLGLTKEFINDPVPPGGQATLRFTAFNGDHAFPASAIAFTDDLDAVLSGLTAVGLPASDVCGAGSLLSGTSLLSLTGGTLASDGSCTFDVTVQVPGGASLGGFVNTTSQVTGTIDGNAIIGDPAGDLLFVSPVPLLAKAFLADPVGSGDLVTMEFTLTNTSPDFAATGLQFLDDLSTFLNGATVATLPPGGSCGAGSAFFTQMIGGDLYLAMSGGNLAPGGVCTFSVDLQLPVDTPQGTFTNTTGPVNGTVDGQSVVGPPAGATLEVVGAPSLAKEFTDDPALPGATVTLEFTLSQSAESPDSVDSIAFTDDLDAVLPGLVAVGLPAADVCGSGSQIDGTSLLSFTGGVLAPGESCVFSVTVQIPAAALPGTYTNTTSNVSAEVSSVATLGGPATTDLRIAGLSLSKAFTDDPSLPGGTVNLQFTLENSSPTNNATSIQFTDNLGSVLPGLAATGTPMNDVCGTGSQIAGTSSLTFSGGSLAPGSSCSFSVTLQVPGGATDGAYNNTTGPLLADIDGAPVVLDPASDVLTVDSVRLALSKEFLDDPVLPGTTVTLRLALINLDATQPVTAVTLSDDLDATLSGLVALGLPASNVCGAGSQLAGTSLLTLTGASLAAGGACSFDVTLQVPPGPLPGEAFVNTTSAATGDLGGLTVTGVAATDTLHIAAFAFGKSFDGPTVAGGQPVLTFTIENLSSVNAATDLRFADDLATALAGLTALGLPASGVCGPGSSLGGTTFLTLLDAALDPGDSCSFDVTLQVPAAAAAGTYLNVTGVLFRGGVAVADPATASLSVEPPPTFAKAFAPTTIPQGDSSTLTLVIDNGASAVAAGGLDFTDNLPAGLVVANPANAATTCTGGIVTASPGSSLVAYSGGSVGAGSVCTVSVDVTGATVGTYLNVTGDLTSSSGNSGTANATLEVIDVTSPTVTGVDSVPGTGDGELEECETARRAVSALLVTFDEPMFDPGSPLDPNAVTNPDNWRLIAAGPDRDLSTTGCGSPVGDDVAIVVDQVTYDGASLTARLELNGPLPLADAAYRLLACANDALVDASGNALDGDGDGSGGDDFTRTFRVDHRDALANGHFDCSLDGWSLSNPSAVSFSTEDLDAASISGSAAFENPPGNVELALGQCATVIPESIYELSGAVRLDTAGIQIQALRTCELFVSRDCSGTGLPPQVFFSPISAPGTWQPFADPIAVALANHSALCQVTLRNVSALQYSAHVDDLSLDGIAVSIIFADGFESGDLSAWTSALP